MSVKTTAAVQFHEAEIDSIFDQIDQCCLPGAAVGIAIGGKPVYRKGFGLASLELPTVLSPTTRMRLYSVTKHFACLAYLLLCEEGRTDIDDSLGRHFPELHPVSRRVTMRQLMGNISGLRDANDIRWQFSGREQEISSAQLLSLYRAIEDVNFVPGTEWCYNNGGFQLLSAVIERITGQSFDEVLRTRIFEPVGMYNTLVRRSDQDFVPNSATMHMTNSAGRFDRSYLSGELTGEGGVVSTVDDMLLWLAHMRSPVVGNATTWALMRTPQTLVNGTSTGYGLGLMLSKYRGMEVVHHSGGGHGSNAHMLTVPSIDLDVAIMVNRHDVAAVVLLERILDACLPTLERREVRRRPAVGTFRSPNTGRVIQLSASSPYAWNSGASQVASFNGVDMRLEPDDDGVLWVAGAWNFMKISLTLQGNPEQPTSIRLSDFGNADVLLAVVSPPKPDLESIAGRYSSQSTGTAATVFESESGPRLNTVGRFGTAEYELECLTEGTWRAKSPSPLSWGGILSFDDEGAGFRFSSVSTRNLPFRRCA